MSGVLVVGVDYYLVLVYYGCMIKTCKHCNKTFETSFTRKIFCEAFCQQEYWRCTHNKTGDFSRRDLRKRADLVRRNNRLSDLQKQLCIGGLLGDSSMSPRDNGTVRLRFAHGEKQKEYLEWKRSIMDIFILQTSPSSYENKGFSGNNTLSFAYETIVHEEFKLLYPLFYISRTKKRQRSITWKTMQMVEDFALLIWFLDDGCLSLPTGNINKAASLRTDAYPLSTQRMLKKWFWKRYRIDIKISYDSVHNSHYLRFNTKETKQLMKIFSPFFSQVPECIRYKLTLE